LLGPLLGPTLLSCVSFRCEAVGSPSVIPTLFSASGRVYIFSPGTTSLYALRASDGKELWHAQGIFQAADADQVYLSPVQENARSLQALRGSDGKILWQTRQAVSFRTLGAVHGSVYLYEFAYSALVALNATDGSQRWKIQINSQFLVDRPATQSMQVAGGITYIRSVAGILSAFREESGAPLWHRDFPGSLDARTPWVVAPGVIYLTVANNLYAVRASNGKTLWQRDAASFALDPGGSILYALSNQSLSALHASDGKVLWTRAEPALPGSGGLLALKLIDSALYAGVLSMNYLPDGTLSSDFYSPVSALRASDGQLLWQYQGEKGIQTVAGANGTAYLLDYGPTAQTTSTLAALRASDGHPLWQHTAIRAAGMAFADGALYTGYGGDDQTSGCTATGPVIAAKFRAADGGQLWRYQS
jgi:outer membrane protein assembly factor BamB